MIYKIEMVGIILKVNMKMIFEILNNRNAPRPSIRRELWRLRKLSGGAVYTGQGWDHVGSRDQKLLIVNKT